MWLLDLLRRKSAPRPVHVVGHIADDPQIVSQNGTRYMMFHLAEVPVTVFYLKMLPTTPKRRRGDRVEIAFASSDNAKIFVESLYSADDAEAVRRRNQEYLARIHDHDIHERH